MLFDFEDINIQPLINIYSVASIATFNAYSNYII